MKLTLIPGSSYGEVLAFAVSADAKPGPVTFKLTFKPLSMSSNDITVKVEAGKVAAAESAPKKGAVPKK
jgi:hypothetical protein